MANLTDHTITPAKPEHAPIISAMVKAAYSHYIERIGQPPAPMKADYAQIIESQAQEVYVLQTGDNGPIAGCIILTSSGDSLKVNNLVVNPESQGSGYGRVLMGYAEATARERGLKALTLFTNAKMYENLKLYPKMGFVETERKTEDGYDRVYFRKIL